MKHRLFFLLILFSVCTVSFAADLLVQDRSGWYPADAELEAELRHAIVGTQPDMKLLDISIRAAGGFGVVTQSTYAENVINQEFTENALAGFLQEASNSGLTVESREPAALGPLSGFRVVTSRNLNGTHFTTANLLLFAKRDFYVVYVFSAGDPHDLTTIADEYSSRIQFSPSVEPPVEAKISTKRPGYESGYAVGKFMVLLAAIVVSAVLLVRLGRPRARPDRSEPESSRNWAKQSDAQPTGLLDQ